jgi:phage terminase large subunit-like protein
VVLGVDGARFDDALAIIGTEVETGFQWVVGIWEKPEMAGDDYEHPFDEVDGRRQDVFDRFDVWRMYVDPQKIEHLLDRWQGRWTEKRVMPWLTWRQRQIAHAVRAYLDSIGAGDVSHDGNRDFRRHIRNAVRRKLNVRDDDGRQMFTLEKDRPKSPRKIDAAMAAVLSWEARSDAIAAGATKPRVTGWPGSSERPQPTGLH